MAFIAENDLERALVEAAVNPVVRPRFYDLFLGSEVFAILGGPKPHVDDDSKLLSESAVSLVALQQDGREYLPVFTSVSRIQEAIELETAYMSMNGRKLLEVTLGADLIVNPRSEYGKVLLAEEIRAMLDGRRGQGLDDRQIPAATTVTWIVPEQPLSGPVKTGIVDFLRTEPAVLEGHLLQAQFGGGGEVGHVLVLLLDDIDGALGIMQRFSPRLGDLLPPGVFLDTLPVAEVPAGVAETGCRIYPQAKSSWWKKPRA